MENELKESIKKLFIARACLWAVSLAATVYWIAWSFKIYNDHGGITDEHTFAAAFRPRFWPAFVLSLCLLFISTRLRKMSDKKKEELKYHTGI